MKVTRDDPTTTKGESAEKWASEKNSREERSNTQEKKQIYSKL